MKGRIRGWILDAIVACILAVAFYWLIVIAFTWEGSLGSSSIFLFIYFIYYFTIVPMSPIVRGVIVRLDKVRLYHYLTR